MVGNGQHLAGRRPLRDRPAHHTHRRARRPQLLAGYPCVRRYFLGEHPLVPEMGEHGPTADARQRGQLVLQSEKRLRDHHPVRERGM